MESGKVYTVVGDKWAERYMSDKTQSIRQLSNLIHRNAEMSVSTAELASADQLHENSDNARHTLYLKVKTTHTN